MAWGDNAKGQCTVPTGLSGVVQIAAGYAHTVALRSDGTAVAWGDNAYFQCAVPADLTGIIAIAAGANSYFTMALYRPVGGSGSRRLTVGLTPWMDTVIAMLDGSRFPDDDSPPAFIFEEVSTDANHTLRFVSAPSVPSVPVPSGTN